MIVDSARNARKTIMYFFDLPTRIPAGQLMIEQPQRVEVLRASFGLYAATRRQTRVRWYDAPTGAQKLPFPTAFALADWLDKWERVEVQYGEDPFLQWKWDNGRAPQGATGQTYCGKPSDFDVPKIWSDDLPTLVRGPTGLPICCKQSLRASFVMTGFSYPWRTFSVGLRGEQPTTQTGLGLGERLPAQTGLGLQGTTLPAGFFQRIGLGGLTPSVADLGVDGLTPCGGELGYFAVEHARGYYESLVLDGLTPCGGELVADGITPGTGGVGLLGFSYHCDFCNTMLFNGPLTATILCPGFPVIDGMVITINNTLTGVNCRWYSGIVPTSDGGAIVITVEAFTSPFVILNWNLDYIQPAVDTWSANDGLTSGWTCDPFTFSDTQPMVGATHGPSGFNVTIAVTS